jgi:UDP-N-acetyl-D-galactosamine dehydrogenase
MNYESIRKDPKVAVVGLGYVGLPLAVALGKAGKVYGFDLNSKRIEDIKKGRDTNGDLSRQELGDAHLEVSTDEKILQQANVIVVCVPTPLEEGTTKPDITLLKKATASVGKNMKKDSIVAFESTVWPGTTEEICLPILEKESGMKLEKDFGLGYSPERINPGDKVHTIDKITKVVSGHNQECCNVLAEVYKRAAKNGVFKAASIKVAEAAKIIENTQRDLNIALMNELSIIFEKLNIRTYDVLEAAKTKWNFLDFYPGLVGGHCIGVDPYYLTYKAEELGYQPQVILAGRKINDQVGERIANRMIEELKKSGKKPSQSHIYIMGLTFKEDVADIRNSKAKDVIDHLKKQGCTITGSEPIVDKETVKKEFGIENKLLSEVHEKFDGLIIINKHQTFKSIKTEDIKKVLKEDACVIDTKHMLPELSKTTRYITL